MMELDITCLLFWQWNWVTTSLSSLLNRCGDHLPVLIYDPGPDLYLSSVVVKTSGTGALGHCLTYGFWFRISLVVYYGVIQWWVMVQLFTTHFYSHFMLNFSMFSVQKRPHVVVVVFFSVSWFWVYLRL